MKTVDGSKEFTPSFFYIIFHRFFAKKRKETTKNIPLKNEEANERGWQLWGFVCPLPHILSENNMKAEEFGGGVVWDLVSSSRSSNCIVKGFAITVSQDLSLCLYAHTHTHTSTESDILVVKDCGQHHKML